jgi:hypothetical protein
MLLCHCLGDVHCLPCDARHQTRLRVCCQISTWWSYSYGFEKAPHRLNLQSAATVLPLSAPHAHPTCGASIMQQQLLLLLLQGALRNHVRSDKRCGKLDHSISDRSYTRSMYIGIRATKAKSP